MVVRVDRGEIESRCCDLGMIIQLVLSLISIILFHFLRKCSSSQTESNHPNPRRWTLFMARIKGTTSCLLSDQLWARSLH